MYCIVQGMNALFLDNKTSFLSLEYYIGGAFYIVSRVENNSIDVVNLNFFLLKRKTFVTG